MGRFLFTIGLGVVEKPDHWRHVCRKFASLAEGLRALGHDSRFVVNPRSHVAEDLAGQDVRLGGYEALAGLLAREAFSHGFVWGGRFGPDAQTLQQMRAHQITPVFAELAWFPQKERIYFDLSGTNAGIAPPALAPLSAQDRAAFQKRRAAVLRQSYGCTPLRPGSWRDDQPMRVFVPLQDEYDTNIAMDSPFRSMNRFVAFLSQTYPQDQFTIRAHPRAEPPHLDAYPNVTAQGPVDNVVAEMAQFDLIAGINSTLLSEAALLGQRTVCFGDGIAARFGLAPLLDASCPPPRLWHDGLWQDRDPALAWLLEQKQVDPGALSDPAYLQQSDLGQMLGLAGALDPACGSGSQERTVGL